MALVDADFLVYRVGFASEDKTPEIAKSRLTELLTDVVFFDLGCTEYKAWITGKTNFRYDIAVTQTYKGNRKDMKKPEHYAVLREHLQRLGAKVTEGEEADDAVAIENTRGNYWMVHVDKDLDQLPGWHYNPIKEEKYYVTPEEGMRNFYTQVLTGDRTDHIKGLWKVGPVKAKKILEDCVSEVELYQACVKAYEEKGETLERVIENAKLLWLRRVEGEIWEPPV